ncbi:hypothetical protein E1B28_013368 [Marasmius oreades]|uniref:Cytochrome c oxidase copper chaperone n=1 Tax=Marasmius oreades TaxID=181124 RepID=A0A9P7RQ97_9AGAR|nr:uncharacterized protein E1B28_013368 [Marasmius oreades]KAG7087398.1 hypothetical protein E1B28_013368 [Marasmius oreades]
MTSGSFNAPCKVYFNTDHDQNMLEKLTSLWSASPPIEAEKPYDPSDPKLNPLNPQGLKPCCACPQTKSARDDCFLRYGPTAEEDCKELVQNHLTCMRSLGFKI